MKELNKIALVTIVVPAYCENENLRLLYGSLRPLFSLPDLNFQVLFIDDGSTDSTWDIVCKLAEEDSRVSGLRLSRNFGKEAALSAGLANIDSDAAIFIDADLQHPPDLIPRLIHLWRNEGFEIVEAVKSTRARENFFYRSFAKVFYLTLSQLAGIDFDGSSDFKLLDRRVVEALKGLTDTNFFFRGMIAWMGFRTAQVPFQVQDRMRGTSRWSIRGLFNLASTGITSFSSLPLHLVTAMGGIFLVMAFIVGVRAVIVKFRGEALDGITLLILLVLITGSFIMISLGIIGEYIGRILAEARQRPRYVVRNRIGKTFTPIHRRQYSESEDGLDC